MQDDEQTRHNLSRILSLLFLIIKMQRKTYLRIRTSYVVSRSDSVVIVQQKKLTIISTFLPRESNEKGSPKIL